MITGVGLVCAWVSDQDEAYDFYVHKLGLQVLLDAPMDGGGRWLLVHSPAQPEVPIMLAVPGPPVTDEETAAHIRALVSTGYLGPGALSTDDCRATYKELLSRGVEFTEEPSERFYGIDAGFRDPFGNQWRLTRPTRSKPRDRRPGHRGAGSRAAWDPGCAAAPP